MSKSNGGESVGERRSASEIGDDDKAEAVVVEAAANLGIAREIVRGSFAKEFITLYEGIRRRTGEQIISKEGFDPVEVPQLLPYMVVLDLADPGNPIFRLAGTKVVELIGQEPTGKPYLDFVPQRRWQSATESYLLCSRFRCGMITNTVSVNRNGRSLTCEIVNLPAIKDYPEGQRLFLLAVCVPASAADWHSDEGAFGRYTNVIYRCFIDLGCGVPDVFAGAPVRFRDE